MEIPIGAKAKTISLELENFFRKHYGDEKYTQYSDSLRGSLYETIIKILKDENVDEVIIQKFIKEYLEIDNNSIDKILQLNNGEKIIEGIKTFLNEHI